MSISQNAYCLVSLLRERGLLGGQKKCFKDTLKASFKDFSIDPGVWENLALDRTPCHTVIHHGAASYETQ